MKLRKYMLVFVVLLFIGIFSMPTLSQGVYKGPKTFTVPDTVDLWQYGTGVDCSAKYTLGTYDLRYWGPMRIQMDYSQILEFILSSSAVRAYLEVIVTDGEHIIVWHAFDYDGSLSWYGDVSTSSGWYNMQTRLYTVFCKFWLYVTDSPYDYGDVETWLDGSLTITPKSGLL
ncbi:MAG: hypothetical protein ACFFBD_27320 [Candidatus Hodarchaeota archaeon]